MPFDIGFVELCTILVVSLIVLGPDKLPIAARALSRFFRTVTRTVNSFKREVDRELQMDELKRQMQEQQQQFASLVDQANSKVETAQNAAVHQASSESVGANQTDTNQTDKRAVV